MCFVISSVMVFAASCGLSPPTPVPRPGKARLFMCACLAHSSAALVAALMSSRVAAMAGRIIVGACMMYFALSLPAVVAAAMPMGTGAFFSACFSISFPPALRMAPATPPPIVSWLLAGFTMASTSSFVISHVMIVIVVFL